MIPNNPLLNLNHLHHLYFSIPAVSFLANLLFERILPSPMYRRKTQKRMTRKTWVLRQSGEGLPRMWSIMVVQTKGIPFVAGQDEGRNSYK